MRIVDNIDSLSKKLNLLGIPHTFVRDGKVLWIPFSPAQKQDGVKLVFFVAHPTPDYPSPHLAYCDEWQYDINKLPFIEKNLSEDEIINICIRTYFEKWGN